MATPDMNHRSTEVEWSVQPDYTHADNDSTFRCALTGFPKRTGEVIYRGPHIDDFYGFFAIGQDAAEQLARLIGWVDPDTIDSTVQQAVQLADEVDELKDILAEREEQIRAYEETIRHLVRSEDEDAA